MTANQFRTAIEKLGLSQRGAGSLFGVDERTSRRWALGERAIPTCVGIMLRLLLAKKITVADVLSVSQG